MGLAVSKQYPQTEIDRICKALPHELEAATGNLTATAESLGMTRQALVHLRGSNPAVGEAMQKAEDSLWDKVEARLIRTALFPEDNRGINLTGSIFGLKCRRGDRWNDRQTVVIEREGYSAKEEQAAPTRQAVMSVINGGAPPEGTGTRE